MSRRDPEWMGGRRGRARRASAPGVETPAGPNRLAGLLALTAALVAVALTAWRHLPAALDLQWTLLHLPYPVQGSEGLIVVEAGRLLRGEALYVANRPNAHAFVSAPYPPLYFYAVAAARRLGSGLFTGGRWISFGAWIVTVGVATLLGARGSRWPRAFVGGLTTAVMLAAFTPGILWSVRVKPTVPALALALVGVAVVQAWAGSRRVYLALPCFIAAYYTKQTAIAAPLAATLYLLAWQGPRAALRFAALGALGGGAIFAVLDVATANQFFIHTIADRRLPWQWQLLWNFGGLFLRDSWPLLAAGALGAALLALVRSRSIAPYYFLTALLIVPTIGVVGADHDHLIELGAASSIAAGAALATLSARSDRAVWAALPLALLLLAQTVTAWTPDRWYAGELVAPSAQARAQVDQIIRNLRQTPGEALAEDVGLLALAGKAVPYDDPQAMAALARAGRWDERQLLDDLGRQRFSLVLLPPSPRDELWTASTLSAIRANYYLKFRDVWFTYEANRLR